MPAAVGVPTCGPSYRAPSQSVGLGRTQAHRRPVAPLPPLRPANHPALGHAADRIRDARRLVIGSPERLEFPESSSIYLTAIAIRLLATGVPRRPGPGHPGLHPLLVPILRVTQRGRDSLPARGGCACRFCVLINCAAERGSGHADHSFLGIAARRPHAGADREGLPQGFLTGMQESPRFQLGGAVAGPLPAAGPGPSSSSTTPACPSTAQQHSPACQAAPGGGGRGRRGPAWRVFPSPGSAPGGPL